MQQGVAGNVQLTRAVTVERILRQKIARGVKQHLIERFDKDGDGKVSGKEFLDKVVANPMATLYRSLPHSNPIA
jgi:Ca2+-binding EF-hand superfamily protein